MWRRYFSSLLGRHGRHVATDNVLPPLVGDVANNDSEDLLDHGSRSFRRNSQRHADYVRCTVAIAPSRDML
jgi:hypothetical protein